ncbi:acyl-CoA dehydratase activase-related protein [Oligoflexia bacterium]|nr:acyl-CoA dehydratase activase-related protein [Oligoflexia bacterium]
MNTKPNMIGLDVGSTTVKAVVMNRSHQTLLRLYERHRGQQGEKTVEILEQIETELRIKSADCQVFCTGSGSVEISKLLGGYYVQEVTAISHAVEHFYPNTGSAIELGGHDAKIILFQDGSNGNGRKKLVSMNDKCAGGTGATIDKVRAKLQLPSSELSCLPYYGAEIHTVAGKCGVFAETDINSLQKMGVPAQDLMASLFDAIVQQNLSVLTRGNTLLPEVLLLGGPNTFLAGLVDAWRYHIGKLWEERGVTLPLGATSQNLIKVPEHAQYFAALGAIAYGAALADGAAMYRGIDELKRYLSNGRRTLAAGKAESGLVKSPLELKAFLEHYKPKPFVPPNLEAGKTVEAFVGIDGGSTSTKAVLFSKQGKVLAKSYQFSKGNPIQDTIAVFRELESQVEQFGAKLQILGVGTTGYARDLLKEIIGADVALVETVAHSLSALHYYRDVDVICDVGGQDIKIMILQDGHVKDFKLNTQCSAGTGYFLQNTAEHFGVPIEKYAEIAFTAKRAPVMGFGCAVFLQSDIVSFQAQGVTPAEILAGLAKVLPKNIWLYIAKLPNLSGLGRTFLLQGGTQRNLAAVKAQVDFIYERYRTETPKILVHKHCGEAGAIGAALEARKLYQQGLQTAFIGFKAVSSIAFNTQHSGETRCSLCHKECSLTHIDVMLDMPNVSADTQAKAPILKHLIVGNDCEKGSAENIQAVRAIGKKMQCIKRNTPNMLELKAVRTWEAMRPALVADRLPTRAFTKSGKQRIAQMKKRQQLKIGIPRVALHYDLQPFFSAYFESLGIPHSNLIFSDYTTSELYNEGIKRNAIDPCFPSKLGHVHVHNLLFTKHNQTPLDIIFYPKIDSRPVEFRSVVGHRACPALGIAPEGVRAAFIKEEDLFKTRSVQFISPLLHFDTPAVLTYEMYSCFHKLLGLSKPEHQRAVQEGFKAWEIFQTDILRKQGRTIIRDLEREGGIGIVVLSRACHLDPGVNHGIAESFQLLGYPILIPEALPIDFDILHELFGAEISAGAIADGLDLSDIWKNSYSAGTNRKLWAAKFVARHPNLVALELSSFKCGSDAPIYSTIEDILTKSGTPYFCFKDLDENKPSGSIKTRIQTINYTLQSYQGSVKSWCAEGTSDGSLYRKSS